MSRTLASLLCLLCVVITLALSKKINSIDEYEAPKDTDKPSPEVQELIDALKNGDLDEVKDLLEDGVGRIGQPLDVRSGFQPIHFAAQWKQPHVVKFLYKNGADLNAQEDFGRTPLSFASEYGYLDFAVWLLDEDARFDVPDAFGFYPATYAARGGYWDILDVLREAGADMNAKRGIDNRLPQHFAAHQDRWFVLQHIFNNYEECDIDAVDGANRTALHLAAMMGNEESVKHLLELGAATETVDTLMETPLESAIKKKATPVIKLLKAAGKKPHPLFDMEFYNKKKDARKAHEKRFKRIRKLMDEAFEVFLKEGEERADEEVEKIRETLSEEDFEQFEVRWKHKIRDHERDENMKRMAEERKEQEALELSDDPEVRAEQEIAIEI